MSRYSRSRLPDGRRDSTPRELLNAATPVLWKLILVGLVAGIGVVVGLILFVVPGLILFTVWFVAAPVWVTSHPSKATTSAASKVEATAAIATSCWRLARCRRCSTSP